jgi:uncharacterized protein YdhG (YjbR/CyaY superfamily)
MGSSVHYRGEWGEWGEWGVQRVLEHVRRAIRRALPEADEVISYQIPAYKVPGRVVIYFAGWKEHYSIYPATAPLVAEFKDELAPYEVNNKGTIRFPLTGRIPAGLIAGIARFGRRRLRSKQPPASGPAAV